MATSLEEEYQKAYAFYQAGSYQLASDFFAKLIKNNPYDPNIWFSLASSYQQLKEYEKALQAWAVCAFLDNENALIHFHAAECFLSLQKLQDAFLALDQAKKRCKDSSLQERIDTLQNQWKNDTVRDCQT